MNRHEKMSRKKFIENYSMPWELIQAELELFDRVVCDIELNETNYTKYRRGFLLRAEIAYKRNVSISEAHYNVG